MALRFLTILPVPGNGPSIEALDRAAGYFPVIGLILGVILLCCAALLQALTPMAATAALLVAIWAGLTGGLHLGGFLNCCEALLAKARPWPERSADGPLNSSGVVGVVALLLVKYGVLLSCPTRLIPYALLAAPTIGRWAIVYAAYFFPQKPGWRGPQDDYFKHNLSLVDLLFASLVLLVSLTVATVTLQFQGLFVVLVAFLTVVAACLAVTLLAFWVKWQVGGLSGKVYGTINEVVEVTVLLAVVVSQSVHLPWNIG